MKDWFTYGLSLGFASAALYIYVTSVWFNWYWAHGGGWVYVIERYLEGPLLVLAFIYLLWRHP